MKLLSIFAALLMSFLATADAEGASRPPSAPHFTPAPHFAPFGPRFTPPPPYHAPTVHNPPAINLRPAPHRPIHPYHGMRHFGSPLVVAIENDYYSESYSQETGEQTSPQDERVAMAQVRLMMADAERIELENQRKRSEALAETRKAAQLQRQALIESRRQKNTQLAQENARLSGKDNSDLRAPMMVAWPAALQDRKFDGYRKVVERAAALRAAGKELTEQEEQRLAEDHRAVLRLLKGDMADNDGAACRFVQELQTRGLRQTEAIVAR